ncbi:MAG TPA: ABC transporter substrate-binding protein [Desulfobacterales bacterium]|nr:ABC transporter substrate-binding protein [Desulfobacterales bacterium]
MNYQEQVDVQGFYTTVHQSLTKPILYAGCPRKYAILVWTMTAAIASGLEQWLIIPVGVVLHIVGIFAARKDPEFFDVLLRHIKEKSYLEP